jgi:HTH-type transcriptional regulator / antitoxin HigA
MIAKASTISAADDYMELIRRFPLRAIRNGREHEAAVRVANPLLGRDSPPLTRGEGQYLDALVELIKAYESQAWHIKIQKMPPIELVRYLMRENGMNTEELGRVMGSQTAASLFLNGNRPLSKTHIYCLAERFALEPGMFLERPR